LPQAETPTKPKVCSIEHPTDGFPSSVGRFAPFAWGVEGPILIAGGSSYTATNPQIKVMSNKKYKKSTSTKGFGPCKAPLFGEIFYEKMRQRHIVSFTLQEELAGVVEKLGYELIDTGAMYSPDGEQEGGRDLVFRKNGREYHLQLFHEPQVSVEVHDEIPENLEMAVSEFVTSRNQLLESK